MEHVAIRYINRKETRHWSTIDIK